MHDFKDTKARAWHLEINCDTIEQVKASCAANLLDLADPESDLAHQVAQFPPLICKLLFAACAEQAAAIPLEEREVRRSMPRRRASAWRPPNRKP